MNSATLKAAEDAAKAFLKAAKILRETDGNPPFIIGTKRSGALRRASLDLTRALADMRRPG